MSEYHERALLHFIISDNSSFSLHILFFTHDNERMQAQGSIAQYKLVTLLWKHTEYRLVPS